MVIDTLHKFHQRVRIGLIAGYALFVLVLCALTAWNLVSERAEALAEARTLTGLIARSVDEHVRASFAAIDVTLRDHADRIRAEGGVDRIPVLALHQRFRAQMPLLPQARGIYAYGADDMLRAVALRPDPPAVDGKDLPYVRFHRQNDSSASLIGDTASGVVSGKPVVPITRRLNAADGRYAGVIGASMDPGYFEAFYQSLNLGPSAAIGIFRADGRVLARFPMLQGMSNADLSGSPLFVDGVNKAAIGTISFPAGTDGLMRVVSYRKLAEYPVVVAVSLKEDSVLQAWRADARLKATTSAVVILLMGGLLLFTLRLVRRSGEDAALMEQSRIAATRSLAEAEERYRVLLESSPVGILQHHRGVIEYVNAGAVSILGETSPDAIVGHLVADYVHPDDRAVVAARHALLEQGPGVQPELVTRAVRRDGSVIMLESRSISTRQGERLIGQVVLRDVTEERQAEAALRSSEARFAKIFATSPVGIVLSELESSRCLQVNHAFEQLSGYGADEWLNRRAADFNFWVDRDHAVWRETLIATGKAGPLDLRFRDKGGREGFAVLESFVIEFEGEMRSLAFIQDITARKRAEQSLADNEAKFREVFENASDAMWIVDVGDDGRMTYEDCNHTYADTIGRAVRDVPGRTPRELFPQATADRVLAQWQQCVDTGQRIELTSREGISHGNRYLAIYLLPLKDTTGRIRKIAGVARDFTEIKRAEDEIRVLNLGLEQKIRRRTADLEAAYKELEAFSYSVSHDLRAPARAVAGFSQILLDEHAGELSTETRRLVDRIVAAGARMSELIDGLLVLTHVSRQELQRRRVDMSALAAAVMQELRELDPAREVDVALQPGLFADADPHMVRSLLQNLLGNAWKYTSRVTQAKIEFSAFDDDGRKVFVVRDNGAGFDMEYAQKLFGVFQRMHSDAEFEGTGIGLATVDRIVRRHGGSIRAEARPGEGASFYFTLSS